MPPVRSIGRREPAVVAVLATATLHVLAGCASSAESAADRVHARSAEARGVAEVEGPVNGCGRSCIEGYHGFVARHAAEGGPARDDAEIEALLLAAERAPASPILRLDRSTLDRRVREALAIGDLLTGMAERRLTVGEIETSSTAGVTETRLLFADPEVGSFEGLLLLPAVPGPHPAVLALHGHRKNAASMADEYMGRQLAERGFAVLIPEQRAFDCSRAENRVAIDLLKIGRTLMGLRVYEALLMAKYLAHRSDIDSGRLALLGHSGGSTIADLASRVSRSFVAKVTDYRVDFRDRCGPQGIHCETIPSMVPLQAELGFEGELGIPYLEVPYKFGDPAVRIAILAFLESVLENEGADAMSRSGGRGESLQ